MLSSQVLRTIQLASLGLGWAGTAAARPGASSPGGDRAAESEDASSPLDSSALVAIVAEREAPSERRMEALRALALSKDPSVVVPLVAILETMRDGALRVELERALVQLDAIRVLASDSKSPRPEIRQRAVDLLRVLCDRKSETATAVLLSALGDEEPDVRASGATALGWCGPASSLEALLGRLESEPIARVRSAIALALGHFDGARVGPALEAAALREQDGFVKVAIRSAQKQLRSRAKE